MLNSLKKRRRSKPPSLRRDRPALLYVEDNNLNWAVMQRRLRDDYDIVRAECARTAFEKLLTGTFRAILMDIQLRGSDFDGVEITRLIKGTYDQPPPDYAYDIPASTASIPIVFITAYAHRFRVEDLLEAGGADVMYKPVDFASLRATLSRLISAQSHELESTRHAAPGELETDR